MRFIILLILSSLVTGCGTMLVNDPSLPAIQSGYPSAEMVACGQRVTGLQVCSVKKGEPLDEIKLSVVGYYKGTVRVFSNDCHVDATFRYEGNKEIPIFIPGNAVQSCVMSVTVSPELPKEESSGIVVHSLRGHVGVKVTNGEEWHGTVLKAPGGLTAEMGLEIPRSGEVYLAMSGCGHKYEAKVMVEEGTVMVPLQQVVQSDVVPETCMVDGVLMQKNQPDILFNVFVAKYDAKFNPLPIPNVDLHETDLKVDAEDSVSIVAFDQEFKVAHKGKFKLSEQGPNILRLLTVKGRTVVGIYNMVKDEWEWHQ